MKAKRVIDVVAYDNNKRHVEESLQRSGFQYVDQAEFFK